MVLYILCTIATIYFFNLLRGHSIKTQKASGIRTLVYFSLLTIVATFFYKTNQVSQIFHFVDVEALRASYKNGHINDTVKRIDIYHTFSSSSYGIDYAGTISKSDSDLVKKNGGYSIDLECRFDSIANNYRWDDDYRKDAISQMSDTISLYKHLYIINFLSTGVPRLTNMTPKGSYFSETKKDTGYIYRDLISISDTANAPFKVTFWTENADTLSFDNFQESRYSSQLMCVPDDNKSNNARRLSTNFYGCNTYNKFDFFTAADISQFTYLLQVDSDCPVERLTTYFNVPIDYISDTQDITAGTNKIIFSGKYLETIRKSRQIMTYHIKLPTMANLQMIRNLILTTILTALVTLFLSNVFVYIRYIKSKWRYKHPKSFRRLSLFRIKLYRTISKTIILLPCVLLLYLCYRLFIGKTFLIDNEFLFEYIVVIIGVNIALAIFGLWILGKYAKKPINNENETNKTDADNYSDNSLGLFNEDSEEDLDRVFSLHNKEMGISDTNETEFSINVEANMEIEKNSDADVEDNNNAEVEDDKNDVNGDNNKKN